VETFLFESLLCSSWYTTNNDSTFMQQGSILNHQSLFQIPVVSTQYILLGGLLRVLLLMLFGYLQCFSIDCHTPSAHHCGYTTTPPPLHHLLCTSPPPLHHLCRNTFATPHRCNISAPAPLQQLCTTSSPHLCTTPALLLHLCTCSAPAQPPPHHCC